MIRYLQSMIITTTALLPLSTFAYADMYDYNTGTVTSQNSNTYSDNSNNNYNSGGFNWQGGYFGLTAGYGLASYGTNRVGYIDDNAFSWGGYGGYNFQAGSFVYGVEGDLGYAWNKGKKNVYKVEQGVEGSLRVRLGLSLGQWMPYATGGLAGTRTKVDSDIAGGDTKTRFGWTAGVGIDTFLSSNTIGRIEYRHISFDKKSYNLDSISLKTDVERNDFRVGIGYKF